MPARNPTERFSDRVDNYVRYRPGYPPEVVDLLRRECGLTPQTVVADIAAGTGIFTRLLLENGNRVFAVEPNAGMRQACEKNLAGFSRFTSVAGTAESTTLPDHSVKMITAAQAAHWFDRGRARQEFVRILQPGGFTVLIWNERRTDSTPFLRDYEHMLMDYGTDYIEVRHERTTAEIDAFFNPSPFREAEFGVRQRFDYAGLEGRLLSSSYVPASGHPRYAAMLQELSRMFEQYQQGGFVELEYNTRVFYGKLN
jgi:SAM-dependent methyltransferase